MKCRRRDLNLAAVFFAVVLLLFIANLSALFGQLNEIQLNTNKSNTGVGVSVTSKPNTGDDGDIKIADEQGEALEEVEQVQEEKQVEEPTEEDAPPTSEEESSPVHTTQLPSHSPSSFPSHSPSSFPSSLKERLLDYSALYQQQPENSWWG